MRGNVCAMQCVSRPPKRPQPVPQELPGGSGGKPAAACLCSATEETPPKALHTLANDLERSVQRDDGLVREDGKRGCAGLAEVADEADWNVGGTVARVQARAHASMM